MLFNVMNSVFAQGYHIFKPEMCIKRIFLTLYINAFGVEYFSDTERFAYQNFVFGSRNPYI